MTDNSNIEETQEIIGLDLGKYGLSYLKTKQITTWSDTEIDKYIDAFVKEDIAPMVLIPFQPKNIKLLLSQSHCRRCDQCCVSNRLNLNDPGVLVFEQELKQIAQHTSLSYKQLKRKASKYKHPERDDVRYLPLPCIFYQQGECTIYKIRPLICQIYPVRDSPPRDGKFYITISVRCEYGKDIYRSIINYQRKKTPYDLLPF